MALAKQSMKVAIPPSAWSPRSPSPSSSSSSHRTPSLFSSSSDARLSSSSTSLTTPSDLSPTLRTAKEAAFCPSSFVPALPSSASRLSSASLSSLGRGPTLPSTPRAWLDSPSARWPASFNNPDGIRPLSLRTSFTDGPSARSDDGKQAMAAHAATSLGHSSQKTEKRPSQRSKRSSSARGSKSLRPTQTSARAPAATVVVTDYDRCHQDHGSTVATPQVQARSTSPNPASNSTSHLEHRRVDSTTGVRRRSVSLNQEAGTSGRLHPLGVPLSSVTSEKPTKTPHRPRRTTLDQHSKRQGLYLHLDLKPANSANLPRTPHSSALLDPSAVPPTLSPVSVGAGLDLDFHYNSDGEVGVVIDNEFLVPVRSRWSKDSSPGWLHPPSPAPSVLLRSRSNRSTGSSVRLYERRAIKDDVATNNDSRGRTRTRAVSPSSPKLKAKASMAQIWKRITLPRRLTERDEPVDQSTYGWNADVERWMVVEKAPPLPTNAFEEAKPDQQERSRFSTHREMTDESATTGTVVKTLRRMSEKAGGTIRKASGSIRGRKPHAGHHVPVVDEDPQGDWEEVEKPSVEEVYEYVSRFRSG